MTKLKIGDVVRVSKDVSFYNITAKQNYTGMIIKIQFKEATLYRIKQSFAEETSNFFEEELTFIDPKEHPEYYI